jgi:hypothetical protein
MHSLRQSFLLGLYFYICFDIHHSPGRRVAGRSLMPDRSNANSTSGLRSMDLKIRATRRLTQRAMPAPHTLYVRFRVGVSSRRRHKRRYIRRRQ